MDQEHEDVYKVTSRIIGKLKAQEEMSSGKAALAALRHSIGKPLGAVPDIWPIMLDDMPEEFLSHNGIETKEELAIYAALQLYALQRQGTRGKAETESAQNIGDALQKIRKGNGQEALDRRFVAALSATSFTGLVYQLRQLGLACEFCCFGQGFLLVSNGGQRKNLSPLGGSLLSKGK